MGPVALKGQACMCSTGVGCSEGAAERPRHDSVVPRVRQGRTRPKSATPNCMLRHGLIWERVGPLDAVAVGGKSRLHVQQALDEYGRQQAGQEPSTGHGFAVGRQVPKVQERLEALEQHLDYLVANAIRLTRSRPAASGVAGCGSAAGPRRSSPPRAPTPPGAAPAVARSRLTSGVRAPEGRDCPSGPAVPARRRRPVARVRVAHVRPAIARNGGAGTPVGVRVRAATPRRLDTRPRAAGVPGQRRGAAVPGRRAGTRPGPNSRF